MGSGGLLKKRSDKGVAAAVLFLASILAAGCGSGDNAQNIGQIQEVKTEKTTGIANETAQDGRVDFGVLQEENPDIFGWLYIPGTEIDFPLLQSVSADDYYESHDAFGQENEAGALYTELANLKNMCDFNTVIHGKAKEGCAFEKLDQFLDPDFFKEHEVFYVHIEGNLLGYEVFAAFERENTSLLRTYDFTYLAGCREFLSDIYGRREMGKLVREGWDGVSPYNFLVTLTAQSPSDSTKELVVIGVLTMDAAGSIDRLINE